jgi:hypothetical protein
MKSAEPKWINVNINDQFAGNWCWGQGPYVDWCKDNCTGTFNIAKYSHSRITGHFQNEGDAIMFKLRWS